MEAENQQRDITKSSEPFVILDDVTGEPMTEEKKARIIEQFRLAFFDKKLHKDSE